MSTIVPRWRRQLSISAMLRAVSATATSTGKSAPIDVVSLPRSVRDAFEMLGSDPINRRFLTTQDALDQTAVEVQLHRRPIPCSAALLVNADAKQVTRIGVIFSASGQPAGESLTRTADRPEVEFHTLDVDEF